MTTSEVQIKHEPNSNTHVYHTRRELTSEQIEHIERGQITGVSELGCLLIAIPGVTSVFVKAYELTIVKAQMYQWEEIEPQVLGILNALSLPLPGDEPVVQS